MCTYLERRAAASRYNIELSVLAKLGELTSERGDLTEARKTPVTGQPKPLSRLERKWIEAAVRMLIRRSGEYAATSGPAALPLLTMDDLPPLG